MTATMFKHPLFRQIMPLAAALFLTFSAAGQVTCNYTINMFDSFGDGWNGGTLTVVSNGVTTTHTLSAGASGTSTFQVTAGTPITISWVAGLFANEPSFNLVNPDGLVLLAQGSPIPAGVVYSGTGMCPNCPTVNPNLVIIAPTLITDTTANINWPNQSIAEYFIVEYGPAGFPLGSGITIQTTASQATLTGLNPCVTYDIYLASFCGVDSVSNYLGPFTVTTTFTPVASTNTCEYTFNLFDSFGDGWNNGALEVKHKGITNTYTFADGFDATFTLTATSNYPIDVTHIPSIYPFEVSYEMLNPSGSVIFSDGPNPQVGKVFTTIACPTCPGPTEAWMSDVNANNARLAWKPSPGATGNYIIEHGPMGFTLGTGTRDTVPAGQLSSFKLTGLAENSWYNVYIKLDCGTEHSKTVGPVMFHTLWMNDLGVSGITMPTATSCNLTSSEEVTIALHNYGQAPQTLFEFYFAVNGQVAPIPVPQDGLFTGVLGNDSTQVISFETNWDFSLPGIYHIQAWTVLPGDSQPKNDTFSTFIITAYPKPMKEDFEDNSIPGTWTTDGTIFAPNSHNNPTFVLGRNLYPSVQSMELVTNRVGPIVTGDTLKFDYRYVNWSLGTTATTLSANDKLEVQISKDCEATWQTVLTINSANHVAATTFATKSVLLNAYNGQAINVRFRGTYGGSGDYWLDLDNINITGCPAALYLLGSVHGSLDGGSTGSINLSIPFDQGPFTYIWTNAAGDTISTEEDPTGLPVGTYSVAVTSGGGCTGFQTFTLGVFVAADEVEGLEEITLYPNPTSGRAFVDVKLLKNMDVQMRLLNLNGQVVFQSHQENATSFNQELDLSNQAPGMYILQIIANGKPYHAKLMVAR